MFAAIYQMYVYKEKEETYKKLWDQVAQHFIQHRGALGSCLHKTSEGAWIAYSRWPDKATREASWPSRGEDIPETLCPEIKEAITQLKQCVDYSQPFQEINMEVVSDRLLKTKSMGEK